MTDLIAKLRILRNNCAEHFAIPIDIPVVAQKLDLESRKGDQRRQFKHIHQGCRMLAWDFEVACQMRTLLLLDGYLALHDAKAGLPIYAVTRSAIELHGLVLNVTDRLRNYAEGDPKDWRSRGEGFFSYLVRAKNGTRDPELIAKLTALGLTKGSLEPIHSKECESALFSRKDFEKDKVLYNKLCDFVHTNSQGYYVGSPGSYISDQVHAEKVTIFTTQPGPVVRYQYPAGAKFEEAITFTADAMFRHCSGVIATTNRSPKTPYSDAEILQHTGTKTGMIELVSPHATVVTNPYTGQNVGRNDPCPCGSGKKYKHCHLN